MKVLLLTDIPPSKGYTGGLFIHQLCKLLPKDSVACFAVVNPGLKDARLSTDLGHIPIEYHPKPREYALPLSPAPLRDLSTLALDSYNSATKVKRIAQRAIEFGRKFGADVLWCLLEGQTMIRLALSVSRGLGVPLLTQIMDPPGWWLREYRLDRISASKVQNEFGRVMESSAGCAAGSWAMARRYERDYGTRTVPVLPSLDPQVATSPAREMHDGTDFIIGMAGQTYAAQEWNALLAALNSVGWKLDGRDVKVRLLGREAWLRTDAKMRVEFLGWHTQDEAIRSLSEADVLYCPYWFDPAFETEARLSFPGKLTTYLATGRPVLFHGPEYASPGRFLQENDAAIFCRSLEKTDIVATLTRLATDEGLYSQLARNGHAAFVSYLTFASQRKSFAEFLQVEEDWLAPAGEQG